MNIDLNENGFCVKNENEEVVFSINAFTNKEEQTMIDERDCDNCQNKTEQGCTAWECEFKPLGNKPHWKMISPAKIYECSECGQNVMTDDIECYKFCHGCGARMGE